MRREETTEGTAMTALLLPLIRGVMAAFCEGVTLYGRVGLKV
jgi:hypothetical protein